jgi:hypothetical protein
MTATIWFGASQISARPAASKAAAQLAEIQAQGLGRVAASAQERLEASDGHYDMNDFDVFVRAKRLTTTQCMEAKRLISDLGMTLDQALTKLRIT